MIAKCRACTKRALCTFRIPSAGSPSDEVLCDVAVDIPGDWYQLSIHLGLRKDAADDILHDLHFAKPSDKAFQALVTWRNSFTDNAMHETLADGLRKVNRCDLVDKFCIAQVKIGFV